MKKQSSTKLTRQTHVNNEISRGVGLALNNSRLKDAGCGLALNFTLEDGNPPEWIELIPAGKIKGHDGRSWDNSDPAAVIAETVAKGKDLPVDLEHSTEILAPNGIPAPAVGRIKATAENFEVRDGAIFGKVKWNADGDKAIRNEEYFYYSPVFHYALNDEKTVLGIKSVGLTNNPNLTLTALNNEEKPIMDLKELLALLGLAADGTMADCLAAVKKLQQEKQTAMNSAQNPSLDKFVPRVDYDTAMNRVEAAEKSLDDVKKAEQATAINTEVDAALKAGKISPASKDYHVANCQAEGGLERFKEFVASAPVIAEGTTLDDKKPAGTGTALNAEQKQIADQLGLSHADYAAELNGED